MGFAQTIVAVAKKYSYRWVDLARSGLSAQVHCSLVVYMSAAFRLAAIDPAASSAGLALSLAVTASAAWSWLSGSYMYE